ncbi:MAG: diacylglycerol kinase family protein [Gaiellales bacterium]
MAEIAFLVNPASDNGRTGRTWPQLYTAAAAAGLDGETLLSDHPGHIAELVERAAADGARLVVAVGGDGTVNEAANGLVRLHERGEPTPELAVLPRGTGRDFVRTFGIPGKLDEAIRIARDGEAREIDAGRAEYRAWDGHDAVTYFANVASAGMSGAVAQRANTTSKALGGKASFLAATLAVFAGWKPGEMEVEVDGERSAGLLYDVLVANCRFLGGGMKMTPDADPTDGAFDVLLIGDITRRDLALTLPKVYRGTHLPHPKAKLLRGREVAIRADSPVPVELDGEQPGTTPAHFRVVPGAIRLRVP